MITLLCDKICLFLHFKQAGYVMNVYKHHCISSNQPENGYMCAAMVLVYKNQETLIAVTKCLDILLRTTIYRLHLTNVVLRIVYEGYWINV